ncbi:MAG: hypothetical protein VYD53_01285 [Pseudomonadota bacterium]|nr:hypothetical protein [Pseudomonadota bacterium]
MNKEQIKILNQELVKEKCKKYVPFFIIVVALVVVFVLIKNTQPTSSEVVTGTAINYKSILHDEGHDIDIYVQLEDKERPVRVRLSKNAPILIGRNVELNRVFKENSDYEKYIFLRYIDD